MIISIPNIITGKETSTDSDSPLSALIHFYQAFNSRNLDSMSRNWAKDNIVSMSNPLGGIKRGWSEIETVYKKIFTGPAEVYVEFYDYQLHQVSNMFVAVGRERGYLKVDGSEIPLAIRTSRIYQKHDGHWLQLHHHGSMDNHNLLKTYQETLSGLR